MRVYVSLMMSISSDVYYMSICYACIDSRIYKAFFMISKTVFSTLKKEEFLKCGVICGVKKQKTLSN